MDLDTVKKFLHIDFDDDDDLILLMINAGQEYIKNAVGEYNDNSFVAKLLLLNLVTSMYETRTYTISQNDKQSYTVKSMIMQLQLEQEAKSNDS